MTAAATRIAYSPCPNDTFVFHALTHGLVAGAPAFDVDLADIDVTNGWLAERTHAVLKISYGALPWALQAGYRLLPTGGALGHGCGPLLLVKPEAGPDPARLGGSTVAVPSERSTAYLLFRLWAEAAIPGGVEIRVMPFAEIMPAVAAGRVDAGLVIHEARFTYPDFGLVSLVDLGAWWESDTGLPIPLGAIVARDDVDAEALTTWIRASVEYAWAHPEASADYIGEHAQEMDQAVQRQHIELYVNGFTRDLGDEGRAAVRALLERAAGSGLVPATDLGSL